MSDLKKCHKLKKIQTRTIKSAVTKTIVTSISDHQSNQFTTFLHSERTKTTHARLTFVPL